jgi:energy-converting hydrogenase Eha subunit C
MKVMLKKIDFKFLFGAVACFIIGSQILNGTSGIYFADPLNEMLTFALVCVGGIVCLAAIKK